MRQALRVFVWGFILVCLVGALTPARAVTPGEALTNRSMQAIQTPEGSFVQNMGKETLDVINDETLTLDQQKEKFRAILRKYFDLPTIARFALGREWNAATPEQQQEYLKLFEDTVVKMYADRLANQKGRKSLIISTRRESDTNYIVMSQIMHPDRSQPTKVEWRIRNKDGAFAIVDVVIEGVSQSITKREEYASILSRSGGKIDVLLAQMRAQVHGVNQEEG